MNKTILDAAYNTTNDDYRKRIMQTEVLLQLLKYCAVSPGASITITIEHDHGHKATAELYDHAALVQSLYESIEYFQSEIMW